MILKSIRYVDNTHQLGKTTFGSMCYVREDNSIYMGTTEKYWTQITIEENDNPKTFPKKPYRRRFY